MIRLSRGTQVEKVIPPLFQVESLYRVGQVGVQPATKSALSRVTCYFLFLFVELYDFNHLDNQLHCLGQCMQQVKPFSEFN